MNAVTGESAVTCRPLCDPDPASTICYVMMTLASIAKVKSALGGVPIPENEVLLQVPVKVTKPPLQPFNALFAPYAWVDTPGSLTGGREIYGFNKCYGSVPLPTTASLLSGIQPQFGLQTFGGNLNSPALGLTPLIDITQGPLINLFLAWTDLIKPLAIEFQALLNSWATGPNPTARQIFLKQFQSVDGIHACEQQITYADYNITLVPPLAIIPYSFNIAIQQVDTHPLLTELGIPAAQVVNGGFVLTEDFTLGVPKVLWP